jgi:hypothetical protein
MLPYASSSIEYGLQRLCQLRFIVQKRLGKTTFYTTPKNRDLLINEKENILHEDQTEYIIIQTVHELIMNLYPLNLIRTFSGAIRPDKKDILEVTEGMTFDIFYRLAKSIEEKQFLAIDVYTRLPVNGYVVNSFLKKIEWSNHLKDKTFGMIVYKNATLPAINIANRNGIRFVRLSDLKINDRAIRESVNVSVIG